MIFTGTSQAIRFVTVCFGLAFVVGCAASRPTLHESFGASFCDATQAQAANPRASENLTPVVQMNGPAAKQSMDAYVKSFEPNAEHKSNSEKMYTGLGAAGGGE